MRFRSSAVLAVTARFTCRYCGTTFTSKIMEWQDDVPMPTAQEVYPYLSADLSDFEEKPAETTQQIPPSAPVIDFRREQPPHSQIQSSREPQIAAWAAGTDIDEDAEITAQPKIAPRQEVCCNTTTSKIQPAETAELRSQPHGDEDSAADMSADNLNETTDTCTSPVFIQDMQEDTAEDEVVENIVEFPKFLKRPSQLRRNDAREMVIETASSAELLERPEIVIDGDASEISTLIIEEEELRCGVAVNDGRISKFNRDILFYLMLSAIAFAIVGGLLWMIIAGGKSVDSKNVIPDFNAAIRNDIEKRFEQNSPKSVLTAAAAAENSIEEIVTILPQPVVAAEPSSGSSAAVGAAVVVSPVAVPAAAKSVAAEKMSVGKTSNLEIESARVEMAIINADGKLLRLTSRSCPTMACGGEIVFDVSAAGDSDSSDCEVERETISTVDPIAMKILSISRRGGLLGAAAESAGVAGGAAAKSPVYVWCEFYDSCGLPVGTARGVVDENSLSLQPGKPAVFKMFFQPCLSVANAVPDEIMFQSVSTTQGSLAMADGTDAAFVGMPVFFNDFR
ncbi:MAG TPA: hypothetical protein PKK48_01025 [Phycisphaerae bacterium]|nr:hypothetical protein [Phycisphaerae bacterium]